jgi:hypothetical protein
MEVHTILEFESGHNPLWYITKGHVDKNKFADAVNLEYETNFTADDVEHIYMRQVPYGGKKSLIISQSGRGAYKATIIDLYKF